MSSRPRAAVILAAGHGKRMKSDLAKPLHPIGGRSMLDWSLALADAVQAERKVVVWGAHAPEVKDKAEAAGAVLLARWRAVVVRSAAVVVLGKHCPSREFRVKETGANSAPQARPKKKF